MENPEIKFPKPGEKLPEEMRRESLLKGGEAFIKINREIAREFFKKAGLSDEEIDRKIQEAEIRSAEEEKEKEKKERELKRMIREETKKMYEDLLADAKDKGDEKLIKIFESALKVLQEKLEKE